MDEKVVYKIVDYQDMGLVATVLVFECSGQWRRCHGEQDFLMQRWRVEEPLGIRRVL